MRLVDVATLMLTLGATTERLLRSSPCPLGMTAPEWCGCPTDARSAAEGCVAPYPGSHTGLRRLPSRLRPTIRYDSKLRHIGLGREHSAKRVLALIADRYLRIVDAGSGQLLRELTIDPNRDYQPLHRPPGPPKPITDMQRCLKTSVNGVSRHHTW